MDPSRLRVLLEELHAELSRNPPTDARGQELLHEIREDLARYDAPVDALPPDAPAAEPPHTLRGRLQAAAAGLEVSHPQLAAAIEQTMVALSNMGL